MKIYHASEYNFLRRNIDGNVNNFSVDFHFINRVGIPKDKNDSRDVYYNDAFRVAYFIECKYCTPDTNWVFMPHLRDEIDGYSLAEDSYCKKYSVNHRYFDKIFKYKSVTKGVSLRAKNADFTQIKEAHNQLAYAYINEVFDILSYSQSNPMIFIVPIVVTTANLWSLNDDCNLEVIEKTKDFNDICTQYDTLQCYQCPDNLMKQFYTEKFEKLKEDVKQELYASLGHNYPGMTMKENIETMCEYSPDMFFVINYKNFEKAFKSIYKFFSNPDIVEVRQRY